MRARNPISRVSAAPAGTGAGARHRSPPPAESTGRAYCYRRSFPQDELTKGTRQRHGCRHCCQCSGLRRCPGRRARAGPLVQCLTNIVVAAVDRQRAAGGRCCAGDGGQPRGGRPFRGHRRGSAGEPRARRTPRRSPRWSSRWPPRTTAGTPWVLDPVAAGALGWRTEIARKLLSRSADRVARQRLRGDGADRGRRRQGRRIGRLAGGRAGRGDGARRRCTAPWWPSAVRSTTSPTATGWSGSATATRC